MRLSKFLSPLLWFIIFVLVILVVRNLVVGDTKFNFLGFNLFLGFTPLFVSLILFTFYKRMNKFWIGLLAFVWLIFYPNAPYMITDLIHLDGVASYVVYDAIIVFSFSMLSLFFGFYSIKFIQKVFQNVWSKRLATVALVASILLSSFGIYLGRVLRLNSWDLFTEPVKTILRILEQLAPEPENYQTYVMIALFSCVQFLLLSVINSTEEIEEIGNHKQV